MNSRAKCKVIVEPVAGEVDPEAVAAVTASHPRPAILETLQSAEVAGRYSIYAADPAFVFSTKDYGSASFEDFLQTVRNSPRTDAVPIHPPGCGWIGYLAYEALTPSRLVSPREKPPLPLIQFGFYDHALVHDCLESKWYAVALHWDACTAASLSMRLKKLHQRIEQSRTRNATLATIGHTQLLSRAFTSGQYRTCVQAIKEYIAAGDIYQANLSQQFEIACSAPAADVYQNLRMKNPAAFSAFLAWDDSAILSASPELFLQLMDNQIVTRPIKGTRPRTGSIVVDTKLQAELGTCAKEQAELNMIIDLMRNDLGRVCRHGSIEVLSDGHIEAHPTVFHRVGTITGRLCENLDWGDLLRAAFPGGSIVGAPKIRAMQILRELEPNPRGPYCGAIGWIGPNGDMTLSVAIRTITQHRGRYLVHAGGAIVADSHVESEYAEIHAKARGLLASFGIESQALAREMETLGAA